MFVAAYTAAALLHERDQVMASFFKIEFIVCSLSLSLSLYFNICFLFWFVPSRLLCHTFVNRFYNFFFFFCVSTPVIGNDTHARLVTRVQHKK